MPKVAVVGCGKIGTAICKSLSELRAFSVKATDAVERNVPNFTKLDVSNEQELTNWLAGSDAVICSLPYFLVTKVACVAAKMGIAYFDLTEDRQCTDFIKSLESKSVLVPQCGLAPGAVSIMAHNLAKTFDAVKSIEIRVGALPQSPNNVMQYNLTWSTDGLLNEYAHPCELITEGKRTTAQPLEGLETINLFGTMYEAFNTSGGLGSLCETYEGKAEAVNYKTMRYPGHVHLMRFLLKDLGLGKNQKVFVELFDREVPQTMQDVVLILIKVTGSKNGKFMEEVYAKDIVGEEGMTAIQLTTMSGICGVVASWFSNKWEKKNGFVKQEEIDFDSFINSKWGQVYA